MKTVTIPTCANPFVVIINGKKYTYPAGETVEVPDEVAEIIERHSEAKPTPDPVPPPYSGGVKSWNELEDRPFYDTRVEGTVEVTFDGDVSKVLHKIIMDEGSLVFLSPDTPEPSAFYNHTIRAYADGVELEGMVYEGAAMDMRGEGSAIAIISAQQNGLFGNQIAMFFVVYEAGASFDAVTFNFAGIWAQFVENTMYPTYVSYEGILNGELKTLDPKYLPESGSNGGGLPVVKIATVIEIGSGIIPLADADNAALNEVYNTGMPAVIICHINTGEDMTIASVYALGIGPSGTALSTNFAGMVITFTLSDGAWSAVVEA